MLGGMAAAAVNTAINGGNFGYNVGMGALFGGLAGAIGPSVFGQMGGVVSDGLAWSNFLPAVKAGAIVGAALGGLSTAIRGGNFFQNVAFSALGGGITSAAVFGAGNLLSDQSAGYSASTERSNADGSGRFPVLNDPAVKATFKEALNLQDSMHVEQGGQIFQNRFTGQISAEITGINATETSVTIPPPSLFKLAFYKVLGEFHTHPIGPRFEPGPGTGEYGDIGVFQQTSPTYSGHQHFVVDRQFIYGFDRTGVVSRIGPTNNILGR
jgi:hypothetical protein